MFFDPAGVREKRPPPSGRGSVVIALSDSKPSAEIGVDSGPPFPYSGLAGRGDGIAFDEYVRHQVIHRLVDVPILGATDLVE